MEHKLLINQSRDGGAHEKEISSPGVFMEHHKHKCMHTCMHAPLSVAHLFVQLQVEMMYRI